MSDDMTLRIQQRSPTGISLRVGSPTGISLRLGQPTPRGGTYDYEELENKPSIEGHELVGDSTLPQIGVWGITPQQIDQIIYG